MSVISASVRRPVAVSMVFIAIAFLGVISFGRLPIDLLPDLSFPRIVIYATYPDVSPVEIERVVTNRIESVLQRLPGKETVESTTREGAALIVIRYRWGTDMNLAMLHVREAVDNVRSGLPQEGGFTLNILRSDPTADPVMSLSISGVADLRDLKELSEAVIRRRLEQLEGVAQAEVTGGLSREIQVEIDPVLLQIFNITPNQVSAAIDQANVNSPGGRIRRGLYSYSLRTIGEFRTVDEIGDVSIRKGIDQNGSQGNDPVSAAAQSVYLRDIADITDGYREREAITRYNGKEAVGLMVFKESGANAVDVSAVVRATIEQLENEYDELEIAIATDQAEFISAALSNVKQQIMYGAGLAFIVLLLFLRDIRYPIAIALAIPLSVLAAFICLDATGVTLNIMSLGGLALGVGMLVDNSIVVTENIFRHREAGLGALDAAVKGVSEVRNAVITSTLTTIAVFGPIIYIEGVAGALFGALSFAVAFSLAMSILVALVLLPTMAAKWTAEFEPEFATGTQRVLAAVWGGVAGSIHRVTRPFLDVFDRAFESFRGSYERGLDWSLRHRFLVVGIALTLLVFAGWVGLNLRRSVLPEVDQGSFTVELNLPRGTPIEITAEHASRLENALLADTANVFAVFSRIGRQLLITGLSEEETGTNTAMLDVQMKEGLTSQAAVEKIHALESQFPPNSIVIQTGQATALGRLLGGAESDLSIRVSSNDMDRALDYASRLEQKLTGLSEITNVGIGNKLGQPEISVDIDREAAASRGVPIRAVADAIESYMRGVYTSNSFIDFDRKIPITVRLPAAARDSLQSLDQLQVNGVQLRELVTLRETVGASEIRRIDQKSVISIAADLANNDLERGMEQIRGAIQEVGLESGIDVSIAGENQEMQKSIRALMFAMLLAILLVYLIMAAEFESFIHPFTVLLSVPMGAIGAFLALGLTGAGLNTISLIGIVVLIGVVDNDAVVKIDFINQMRDKGMSVRDAILAAGHHRLRPILITTLTTLIGVLPMALGIGAGAKLQQPLAIAIFGGLGSSTLLTLLVLPVIYELFEEGRQKLRLTFGMSAEVVKPELRSNSGE